MVSSARQYLVLSVGFPPISSPSAQVLPENSDSSAIRSEDGGDVGYRRYRRRLPRNPTPCRDGVSPRALTMAVKSARTQRPTVQHLNGRQPLKGRYMNGMLCRDIREIDWAEVTQDQPPFDLRSPGDSRKSRNSGCLLLQHFGAD